MLVAFDTEDNSRELLNAGKSGFEKEVTLIAAIAEDGCKYLQRGGDTDHFLKWCYGLGDDITLVAHNLQYDLGNLFKNRIDELQVTLVKSRLIRASHNGLNFLDSFNHWPMALKKVGEAFDLKKLKMDVTSEAYVMRDCEIVLEAMSFSKQQADKYNFNLKSTIGSCAVSLFHAMGLTNWNCSNLLAYQAYYGGRVELFKKKNTTSLYSYCDINSLYPYCMTLGFPTECCLIDNEDWHIAHGVMVCTINIPQQTTAPLPFRQEDGSITFPCGTIRGVWTTEEVKSAVKNNNCQVIKVEKVIGSYKLRHYYKPYVEELYSRRLACTSDAEKTFWKLYLNNLYGQLANTGIITKSFDLDAEMDGIVYGSKLLADYQLPPNEFVNYLHAAYVTSYARLHLLKFLNILGEKMIYCDTDSVVFEGQPPFTCGKELGQMKLEGQGDLFEGIAPKIYRQRMKIIKGKNAGKHKTTTKAKGIRKRLANRYIVKKKVTQARPFKFKEAVRGYQDEDKKIINANPLSVWTSQEKRLITEYKKKKLIKNSVYKPIKIGNKDKPSSSTKRKLRI